MPTIADFMSTDHHACDDAFAIAEQAALNNNWDKAEPLFNDFRTDMARDFRMEEELLFPPPCWQPAAPNGPVQVMRMEHAQMNSLLDNMAAVLAQKNAPRLRRSWRNAADPDAAAQPQGRADPLPHRPAPAGQQWSAPPANAGHEVKSDDLLKRV